MNTPRDLVAIPPLARTVIYYVLALALVVVSAFVGYGRMDPMWLVIVAGVGGVFFGVAGSNVPSAVGPKGVGTPANPLNVELTDADVLPLSGD